MVFITTLVVTLAILIKMVTLTLLVLTSQNRLLTTTGIILQVFLRNMMLGGELRPSLVLTKSPDLWTLLREVMVLLTTTWRWVLKVSDLMSWMNSMIIL